MKETWQKIRAARKNAGLSQEDVGNACTPPISKAAVGLWEHPDPKKRTYPARENLMTLSRLTKTPIEVFLDDSIDWSPAGIREDAAKYDSRETDRTIAAVQWAVNHQLRNNYRKLPQNEQVEVVIHLYELLKDSALRDSIKTIGEATLHKFLKIG